MYIVVIVKKVCTIDDLIGYCNASGGLYVYWCLWGVQDIAMHQMVYMYIGVYGVCRILQCIRWFICILVSMGVCRIV